MKIFTFEEITYAGLLWNPGPETGITRKLIFNTHFHGIPTEASRRTLRLFASEVNPHLWYLPLHRHQRRQGVH
jgi:hypothetical protein